MSDLIALIIWIISDIALIFVIRHMNKSSGVETCKETGWIAWSIMMAFGPIFLFIFLGISTMHRLDTGHWSWWIKKEDRVASSIPAKMFLDSPLKKMLRSKECR